MVHKNYFYLGILLSVCLCSCDKPLQTSRITVRPTLEFQDDRGSLYTPSTQSLLRTHSVLEKTKEIELKTNGHKMGEIDFLFPEQEQALLKIKNLPMEQLVPRLHYQPANPPDDFDGLNLMLAEYSRNGLSFPFGRKGDEMTHFQTNLTDHVPWDLKGDYDFVPNPVYRPFRVSIVNNCLKPGLWELNAVDRSGEIYHSWFNMPLEQYYNLVAKTNGLANTEFVQEALKWNPDKAVVVNLERLRTETGTQHASTIKVVNERIGYSSQDSRRKLSKGFVLCQKEDSLFIPQELADFGAYPVKMSSFIEPGIYDYKSRTAFNFDFLHHPLSTSVKEVAPKTSYDWKSSSYENELESTYIEFTIELPDNEKIIIGNLPSNLLVQQEDYQLPGFGVGILNASGLAERRKFLIAQGHAPSYAYLVKTDGGKPMALNSHGRGMEQIFIRTYPNAEQPYWELTITSYERIVDLVKYHIAIPESLQETMKKATYEYIPPIYFHYTDNNTN